MMICRRGNLKRDPLPKQDKIWGKKAYDNLGNRS